MANWMAGAVKPSHRGVFRKKAQRAGMSTHAYAEREQHAGGTLGREANLALTFAKFRPKKTAGGRLKKKLHALRSTGAFKKY